MAVEPTGKQCPIHAVAQFEDFFLIASITSHEFKFWQTSINCENCSVKISFGGSLPMSLSNSGVDSTKGKLHTA